MYVYFQIKHTWVYFILEFCIESLVYHINFCLRTIVIEQFTIEKMGYVCHKLLKEQLISLGKPHWFRKQVDVFSRIF